MTAATIAMGYATRVAAIAETSFGTIPTSPVFKTQRTTNVSLRPKITKGTSQEFTTSRHVYGDFLTAKSAEGSFEMDLTYGNPDYLMEGAFCGTWSADTLKAGNTAKFYTIEETYTAASQYLRYVGTAVEALEITGDPSDTIKLKFDLIGREVLRSASALSGVTYTAPNLYMMPATTAGISAVTWGGITATPILKRFSIQIKNNWAQIPVVDDPRSVQFGLDQQDVTGEVECYFDDYAIYEEVLSQSSASLSFKMGDTANQRYKITIPKMSWGDGALQPRRRGGPITLTMPFRGLYSSSSGTTIQIERAIA